MNQSQETKLAKDFFDDCLQTLTKKAHDYAQDTDCFSNFKKIASICEVPTLKVFLFFITVKIARLIELEKKGKSEVGESMRDSLLDIANYSCLANLYNEDTDDL